MKALFDKISELAVYIAQVNTYFDTYFDYALQDETTGKIFGYDKSGNPMNIFPSDEYGNFFYIRYPHKLGFDTTNVNMIADAQGGIGIKADMVLVAAMKDADPWLLIQNIINTMGLMCDLNASFKQALFGDNVILQELARIPKENIQEALKTLADDYTLVAVNFTVNQPFIFQRSNCITNPCLQCS